MHAWHMTGDRILLLLAADSQWGLAVHLWALLELATTVIVQANAPRETNYALR